ncbi:DNA-binding GntR family transcriptional regulator [Leucobacter luti]|uniref:GntR family transcriptional regulator n=1 Tax=Leucobacter luti TaxID=340320 RepID=UPI00104B37CE|nr:GntR family transcriptional regulator [Leucobacter luti]MCW2289567.1 DNA-binding GntR family transcriptional regulator [Leucobacter luti]TCK37739.1 DNA-binding GntR family transcriptional regulator [Leucobacter luti]
MPVPKQRIEIPARRLLRDDVHDAIREAILTGQFAPGERLEDSALQAWLGVSRTPVRQAIDALVREGLVETAAQSFTRVVNPDPRNSRHVSGTVGVLMSGVTRWAVVRLSAKKREHAAALAEQIAQELRSRDRESFARDVVEFFAIMQRECGNPVLQQLCHTVGPSYAYHLGITLANAEIEWDRLSLEYDMLAAAVRSGDGSGAGRAVESIHPG